MSNLDGHKRYASSRKPRAIGLTNELSSLLTNPQLLVPGQVSVDLEDLEDRLRLKTLDPIKLLKEVHILNFEDRLIQMLK